jgi:exosome complex component RRP46
MALVSVSGPIEARLGTELPSKAALELNVRPLSGIPGKYQSFTFARARF